MKWKFSIEFLFMLVVSNVAYAQQATLTGIVTAFNQPLQEAIVGLKGTSYQALSDVDGKYELKNIPFGKYTLFVFYSGKQTMEQAVDLNKEKLEFSFSMQELNGALDEVIIVDEREKTLGLTRLRSIENFSINEGKKNEVILLNNLTANLATNNPRQIYSRITGLNIWESDGVGLQLGIGGRGLSPNRTSNFNTRQNGYDISADALGYPESYYTPPAEALDRIEIIRGAASLQYGTQFGGMLNFRFKGGPRDKKIEFTTRQSIGSWNFFGTFNSIGGTIAKGKVNYYAYYQYKQGDGYRPNSEFDYHNAYASLNYQATKKLLATVEFTHMNYLAHQPGGLTDKMFEDDARQSVRARNWFKVDWNLLALNFTYTFNSSTQLNIRNYGLLAQRESLGNLKPIHLADVGENRTMINGTFENIGSETRLLHRYRWLNKTHAFVAGVRVYRGYTTAAQGDANNSSGADFYFLNSDSLDSDYNFPNTNYAAFIENIFEVNDKISITPGIRFENIQTFSEGYFTGRVYDGAGNIVTEKQTEKSLDSKRSFVIGGIGISYKVNDKVELYGNVSQNYRAINFTDLRIQNPNLEVDSTIHDERGFTADAGIRGSTNQMFTYEVTAFYVGYNDRIGVLDRKGKLYRKNISDARIIGIEAFGELNLMHLIAPSSHNKWSTFVNTSLINAQYVNTENLAIKNKKVEMVPPFMFRMGTTVVIKSFGASLQFGYTDDHFSDATNAKQTTTAVQGIIAAYQVLDLSLSYSWKILKLEGSCNNLLNAKYFTRRAESYPGPGIIPSDGRGFYLTLQAKL